MAGMWVDVSLAAAAAAAEWSEVQALRCTLRARARRQRADLLTRNGSVSSRHYISGEGGGMLVVSDGWVG